MSNTAQGRVSLSAQCVQHRALQANFIQHQGYTIVYRRYASLFFIVGIDQSQVCLFVETQSSFTNDGLVLYCSKMHRCAVLQSPLCVWEFIHRLVEMLNKTFENVSELDIMINSALVRLLWIHLPWCTWEEMVWAQAGASTLMKFICRHTWC